MGESRQRLNRIVSRLIVVCTLVLASTFVYFTSNIASASLQISSVDATGRVALGDSHTCAITSDNKMWCWGDNSSYQLGVGSGGSVPSDSAVPLEVIALGGGRVPKKISAGSLHTCVLATDGTVWCWGDNGFGQIGVSGGTHAQPTQVSLATTATMISAGGNTTCAVLTDNRVQCWGKNQYGQVGNNTDGTTETSPQFVSHIPDWFTVATIEVGSNHTCAVSTTGAAWCWGYYLDGRLGTSQSSNVVVPAATSSLGGTASMISAGGAHTCVVLTSGSLTCFGKNHRGQLGRTANVVSNDTPTAVVLSENGNAVATGTDFTCVLLSSGIVQCFGVNGSGQLASGSTSTSRSTPANVVGLSGTSVDVVAGKDHACAVLSSGLLNCWGDNFFGQVGSNSGNTPETSAVAVGALNVMPTTTTTTTTTSTTTTTTTTTTTVATTTSVPSSTTTPPVLVDAVTTTTSTAPTSAVATKTVIVKRGSRVSASRVAAAVGMTIPKTSQGSMRIAIVWGITRCSFSGSAIVAKRVGKCVVAVTLLPRKGNTVTKRTSIVVR